MLTKGQCHQIHLLALICCYQPLITERKNKKDNKKTSGTMKKQAKRK